MIPEFDEDGNLPPGIYEATWEDIVERFGYNQKREELLAGLRMALDDLASVGCKEVYINGSFVTDKKMPNDFDGCWDNSGVNITQMIQKFKYFLDSSNVNGNRKIQKERYKGELYPAFLSTGETDPEGNNITYLELFQRDKESNEPKGIIKIKLNIKSND